MPLATTEQVANEVKWDVSHNGAGREAGQDATLLGKWQHPCDLTETLC